MVTTGRTLPYCPPRGECTCEQSILCVLSNCIQVPVIMGVLGIWYNNFFDAQSHALLPYDQVYMTISVFI